jgi:hypothetical protein
MAARLGDAVKCGWQLKGLAKQGEVYR